MGNCARASTSCPSSGKMLVGALGRPVDNKPPRAKPSRAAKTHGGMRIGDSFPRTDTSVPQHCLLLFFSFNSLSLYTLPACRAHDKVRLS
jgi:hypothetical protein